ncbi:ABC transporter substrate-binding protein [Albibacterium bauzanense]|uniref:Iron complex transport system substrate-binding protein n=1 Tax=Albibacterium bauzanense TaxID=653929 RepID=A0A4R1LWZ3_9SPHI|nr:ABC transporter substrate-binding protein [Albibacterium bauzanense]TCK83337.1 iron complex transport system substrate-binding protein [Albibacterium bauzanense]
MSLTLSHVSDIVASLDLSQPLSEKLIEDYDSIASKEDLFQWIQQIGIDAGKIEAAADLVADLEERINLVQHKLKFIGEDQKPAVLVLTGVVPAVIETNDYLKEVLKIAGSKIYSANEEEAFNPDILLIISDQMESLFSEVGVLLSMEEWQNTNAVKKNRMYLINGENNFGGYSSRIAEDVEILAEIIYPQYLTFGGNGESWVQFEV